MGKKNFQQIVKEALILVGIGIVALIILNWTTDIFKPSKEKIIEKQIIEKEIPIITEKIIEREVPIIMEPEPSEYPDYNAIKGKNPDLKIKVALITSECPTGGCISYKPATEEKDAIEKRYEIKGKFSRAYLYIEAVVDYERPLTVWDDIYFKMDGFGGHLIVDENMLLVPPGDISRHLYDLRSISYYPTIQDKAEKKKSVNINFFSSLQSTLRLNINVFISSDRPGRIMKEVAIYYECYEGSDCGIDEIE